MIASAIKAPQFVCHELLSPGLKMICAEIEDMGHDVPNGVWMVMTNDTGSVDWAGIAYYSVAEPEPGNDLCTTSVTSDTALVQGTVDTYNLRC